MAAPKGTRPPNAGKGRKAGVPNKATGDVRAVFSAFVEHNADRAQELFDRVAKKDPAKALDLLARLSEFVLPKLARTELAGAGGENREPTRIQVTFVDPLSTTNFPSARA